MKMVQSLIPFILIFSINIVQGEEQKTLTCYKWSGGEECINVNNNGSTSPPARGVVISPVTRGATGGSSESNGVNKDALMSDLNKNMRSNVSQGAVISSPTPVTVK